MTTIAEELHRLPKMRDGPLGKWREPNYCEARLSLYRRVVAEYLAANDAMDKYVDFETRPWAEFLADERRAIANLRLVAKEIT